MRTSVSRTRDEALLNCSFEYTLKCKSIHSLDEKFKRMVAGFKFAEKNEGQSEKLKVNRKRWFRKLLLYTGFHKRASSQM